MKIRNAFKWLISITLFLFSCFLLGCAGNQNKPQYTPISESTFKKPDKAEDISNVSAVKEYGPEDSGFNLELPSGWDVEIPGDGFTMFKNGDIPQIICLYYGINSKNENHAELFKRIVISTSTGGDVDISNVSESKIEHTTANVKNYELTGTDKTGEKISASVTILLKDNNYYILSYSDKESVYKGNKDNITLFLDNLELS